MRSVGKLQTAAIRVLSWPHTKLLERTVRLLGMAFWLLSLAFGLGQNADSSWFWVAPLGLALGPLTSLALMVRRVRPHAESIRRLLAALIAAGLAIVGMAGNASPLSYAILVAVFGPAWGIWQCHRTEVSAAARAQEQRDELALRRHHELLEAISAIQAPHTTSNGHESVRVPQRYPQGQK